MSHDSDEEDPLVEKNSKPQKDPDPWYMWLPKLYDGTVTYEERSDGTRGSIIKYNGSFAIVAGWMFPRPGSIFTLFEVFIIIAVLVVVCTTLAFSSCQNMKRKGCSNLPIADTKLLTLITLCSFVMAFFANLIIQRWWSVRTHIQSAMGSGYDLAANLSSIFTQSLKNRSVTDAETARDLMKRISGITILSFRLLMNSARGEKDIDDLAEDGYITQEEKAYFNSQPNGNPVNACQVIINYLLEASDKGLLGNGETKGTNLLLLNQCVMNLRANLSAADMFVNVQVPYPFVQLVAVVVYSFLIQLIIICASFISNGIADPARKRADIVTGYMTLLLYSLVLLGLLKLFDVLSNPLGDDVADFPIKTYLSRGVLGPINSISWAPSVTKSSKDNYGSLRNRKESSESNKV